MSISTSQHLYFCLLKKDMAERRMISQKITDSDAFMDMPLSAQSLYFHLLVRADDDGFVGNPKKIMRMINANDDDYKLLIAKRFVLIFENGVCVIKHWLIHNLLRADLYKETLYKKEKSTLGLNESGAYTELRDGVAEIKVVEAPKWLKIRRKEMSTANGTQTAPRLGKDRLGQDSLEEENTTSQSSVTKPKKAKPDTDATKAKLESFSKGEFAAFKEAIDSYCAEWRKTSAELKKELTRFAKYWLEKNSLGEARIEGIKGGYFQMPIRVDVWLTKAWGAKPKQEERVDNIERKRAEYVPVDLKAILQKKNEA